MSVEQLEDVLLVVAQCVGMVARQVVADFLDLSLALQRDRSEEQSLPLHLLVAMFQAGYHLPRIIRDMSS